MSTYFISPTGSGNRSGTDLANAAPLTSLNKVIAGAADGSEVRLLADRGTYVIDKPIILSAGGSSGQAISIVGVDSTGAAMKAQFVGSRAASWAPGEAEGVEVFRLMSGANHLQFKNMDFKNIGNGAFRIGANVDGLTISDMSAQNIKRFIENYVSGAEKSASVSHLDVSNVTILGYSSGGIRLQYDSSNVAIRNVVMNSLGTLGDKYVAGVHLDGTAHDISISDVWSGNNRGVGSRSEYWNGDGFVAEAGVRNLILLRTTAVGNTDAGYDLKSSNTVLIDVVSDSNTRNYRLWGPSIAIVNGTSSNPTYYGGTSGAEDLWVSDVAFRAAFAQQQASGHSIINSGVSFLATLSQLIPVDLFARLRVIPTQTSPTTKEVSATDGADNLKGTKFADEVHAKAGHDVIDLGNGDDVAYGDSGNDKIVLGKGNDAAHGGVGNDSIAGRENDDFIWGDEGNDQLVGDAGNDQLFGGAGVDKLDGGLGNDTLVGGDGNDRLLGGAGADIFVFDKTDGNDVVSDFKHGVDKLQFIDAHLGTVTWHETSKGTMVEFVHTSVFLDQVHNFSASDLVV